MSRLKLRPEIKQQFIQALRDGSYKQGRTALQIVDPVTGERRYCCLGVLTDLAVKAGLGHWGNPRESGSGITLVPYLIPGEEYRESTGILAPNVVRWAFDVRESGNTWGEIQEATNPDVGGQTLAGMNDTGADFNAIADRIEEHL